MLAPRPALVLTTIQAPNPVMQALAAGCRGHGFDFIVIGDRKSPADFALEDARYLDLETQRATGLAYADLCPEAHYARKNIGYLIAMQAGVPLIVETDDDNLPASGFFAPRVREQRVSTAQACGWVNVYRYFAEGTTWPRGLPLDEIMRAPAPYDSLAVDVADCPIQQGLADDNPDVDAVYRPCQPLPVRFRRDRRLALGRDAWCPFNSQNTAWWPDAYPLLYLPATCSFRMTDIWRSFVAQRIAWVNGWFEPDLEQPVRVIGRLVRLVEIDEVDRELVRDRLAHSLGRPDAGRRRPRARSSGCAARSGRPPPWRDRSPAPRALAADGKSSGNSSPT